MKTAIAVLLLLGTVSAFAADDYCRQCPRNHITVKMDSGLVKMPFLGRCSLLGSAGDGCNQCIFSTWCDPATGQWYRSRRGICSDLQCEGTQALSKGMRTEEGVPIASPYGPR
jgi:hypothetical protein